MMRTLRGLAAASLLLPLLVASPSQARTIASGTILSSETAIMTIYEQVAWIEKEKCATVYGSNPPGVFVGLVPLTGLSGQMISISFDSYTSGGVGQVPVLTGQQFTDCDASKVQPYTTNDAAPGRPLPVRVSGKYLMMFVAAGGGGIYGVQYKWSVKTA